MLALVVCLPCNAQQGEKRRVPSEQSPSLYRTAGQSELAQENLSRVAASAGQIREVLLKDAGLLVELKRWVAKEATDNGQIVEDASLTDQAVFERLERDVVFRSVATRLVQRYGYLLPAANPDSEFGKEQELVLKERARRQVQIEAQEDSEALSREKRGQETERTTAKCDPGQDEDCAQEPRGGSRRKTRSPNEGAGSETNPPGQRERQQAPPTERTLQAGGQQQQPSLAEMLGGQQLGLELTANPMRRGADGSGAGSLNPALLGLTGTQAGSNLPYLPLDRGSVTDLAPTKAGSERPSRTRSARGEGMEEDVTPVRMVHQANPYADVPSLYDMYVQASVRQRAPERFGLEVFRNSDNDPDAIAMDLPVGPDYVVGPGDGLSIDLWGGMSQRLSRVVDRQGRVSLPEAGPMLVSGRTLGEVQHAVQQALRTQFRDVSVDVSLSRLRTVRVYVVGDVTAPGAYDISSLSTPLNALFVAGGVTPRGSLRGLKHYRGKQLVEEVDAYDLLLHGVRADMQHLENGDTLMVPPIGPQVTVEGMVRRPAIYELQGEKSLADVLELAGGILPTATLRHIEVQRVEAHEKRTMFSLDLSSEENDSDVTKKLATFAIRDGDTVHIFPIAPYNQDAIYLQGHVLRPGRYSYKQGMKLTDLIASYKDLLPEPAAHYAEIVRINAPDFHPSVESFDISVALANPAAAPKLQPLDTVRVFSRYDFEPAPAVWVGGEVRAPGKYGISGEAHLRDAIYLAGGISPDASVDAAQLFRTQPDGTLKIFSVNLSEALAGNPLDNIVLQPRDRLLVQRNLARVDPPSVYVREKWPSRGAIR